MKIEIWNEDQKEEEQPLRLRLRRSNDNIILSVVDEKGEVVDKGNILIIHKDGYSSLCSNVNRHFGLRLNNIGQLEVIQ